MCLWPPIWPLSIPSTWNVGHHILGYRHRSNGRSQTHGLFMTNNQHQIPHLLSLLTTFYVKVEFFQFMTFWSTLTLGKGQKEPYDLAEIFFTCSLDTREFIYECWRKSHGVGFSLQSLRYPFWKSHIQGSSLFFFIHTTCNLSSY